MDITHKRRVSLEGIVDYLNINKYLKISLYGIVKSIKSYNQANRKSHIHVYRGARIDVEHLEFIINTYLNRKNGTINNG